MPSKKRPSQKSPRQLPLNRLLTKGCWQASEHQLRGRRIHPSKPFRHQFSETRTETRHKTRDA